MFDFLSEKFSSIFTKIVGQKHLDQSNIEETLSKVRQALIESDVPFDVVDTFVKEIKEDVVGKKILASLTPAQQLMQVVHDKLIKFLSDDKQETAFSFQIPSTILLMGLQGSGKTTTAAKLAQHLINQAEQKGKKRRIMLASVDYYRPAAIEQLRVLSSQITIEKSEIIFYKSDSNDVLKATEDINSKAKQMQVDILILDTAGRLHVDSNLLEELKQVSNIVLPKYKLLVLDSMTGQESLNIAQKFSEIIGFDGSILTKMDSQTRSGAAFAFRYVLKKPVLFVGSGEKLDDLRTI